MLKKNIEIVMDPQEELNQIQYKKEKERKNNLSKSSNVDFGSRFVVLNKESEVVSALVERIITNIEGENKRNQNKLIPTMVVMELI